MIIDTFRPDPEGPDHIYKRWRDAEGNLVEETVSDFRPYFWIRASTPTRIANHIIDRYPGSEIDWTDRATALRTEEELVKVYAYRSGDIRDMAREFRTTWEADLSLTDRYLIDEVEEMPDWKPRVWHFDLEWDPHTDETTVMAVIDNYNNRHIAFCWQKDNPTGLDETDHWTEVRPVEYEDNGEVVSYTYERIMLGSEEAMHNAFLAYMDKCNPDIFVAHAIMWADLPHLVRRLPEFRRLSPLSRMLRPGKGEGKKKHYDYVAQPIIGRLCFDTASPIRSGSGFERVWKDSGKPQLKNLKLDTIAKACKLGGKFDMDVFTGWTERFDEYVDYCMQDTLLLKRIDEDNHVLNFFLSLQKLCGVSFSSCHNVTRFARGLLSRRTDWKAPSKSTQEKQEYEGAFIPPPKPGRYEGVATVDYKGLYPSIILSHCLSWETQVPKHMAEEEGVRELPDGTCWRQDPEALLPTIVNEMFALRDMYKKKMREASTENERNGWNTMQLAVKRVMASLYGMTASAYWGWSDFDIASAITACGREAIKFLMEESQAQGYEALYGHTDSAFVKVPFDEAPALAKHLTEDEGKVKSARWGKISTLSPISKNLENDVLTAICSGADEEEATQITRPLCKRIKRGEVSLKEIATTTRLQKAIRDYSQSTGGAVKAARYFNQHLSNGKKLGEGDSVNWVYVSRVPDNLPPTEVVAYEDESDLNGFDLDYDKMVDKLVKSKMKGIFGAMNWNLDFATGEARPKRYW